MRKFGFWAAAILCGSCGALSAAPVGQEFIPSRGLPALQSQANHLASAIAMMVRSTEASSKMLSPTSREASIQTGIQSTIMASGDEPQVVLAALRAFSLCSGTGVRYSVSEIPVDCTNLKDPLSPEAREALASLEKVIVAMADENDVPGALGLSGTPPFVTAKGLETGGGGRDYSKATGNQTSAGGGGNGLSSVASEPGPGGGGSSGYNTN